MELEGGGSMARGREIGQWLSARDAMSSPVIFVHTGDTMAKAAETLLEKGISGTAVLDSFDRAVGVITKTDFLKYERERKAKEDDVGHWMMPGIVAVEPSTPLREVGRIMAKKRIHRVFVQEGDRIVGIVTSLDALEAMGGPTEPRPRSFRGRTANKTF
jgi:acetoin utilization protein AcuB